MRVSLCMLQFITILKFTMYLNHLSINLSLSSLKYCIASFCHYFRQLKIPLAEYSQALCLIQKSVPMAPECTTGVYKLECLKKYFTKVQTFTRIMQARNLVVFMTLTSATFREPDFDDIFDQLERIRFCSNGNCRVCISSAYRFCKI